MSAFEYKVVPAPAKGAKAKGLRNTPDRFANALETVMNELGADGWEYLRADTLPCEEREGLMGKTTAFQHMLVFRRTLAVADAKSTEESFNAHVNDALTAPEPAPEAPKVEKPALKQPPVIATPEAPAVPTPAPRPSVAAE